MKKKIVFLLVIPVLYFFLANYFRDIFGFYSLRSVDPEYIYFASGLDLANLRFDIGHIDNPGTPLQYFIALVFKIIYFIRSGSTPFIEDVLTNSDLYLTIVNFSMNFLVFIFLAWVGIVIYDFSSNLPLSILVQTAPFITNITYDNMGKIAPEMFLVFPCLLLIMIIIRQIQKGEGFASLKAAIYLGIVSGFGLSVKLTYFPLWLIPLIIVPGLKNKLINLFAAILAFLLISLPVTLKINVFWLWIRNLVTHSGNYGSGENNFVDIQAFTPHIRSLISANQFFFILVSILIVVIILQVITKKWSKNWLAFKTSVSVLICILMHIMLVGKHFDYRYLFPSLLLYPLVIFLIMQLIQNIWRSKLFFKLSRIFILLFFLIGGIKQISILREKSFIFSSHNRIQMLAYNSVKCLEKESIRIIVPRYYGSPAHEYAMVFAEAWAGKPAELYRPALKKMYPHSYLFYRWEHNFRYWGEKPDLEEAFNKDIPIYIVISDFDADTLTEVLDKTKELSGFQGKLNATRLVFFEEMNEGIFKVIRKNF